MKLAALILTLAALVGCGADGAPLRPAASGAVSDGVGFDA